MADTDKPVWVKVLAAARFALGLTISAGAIYTAGFGVFDEVYLRSGMVALACVLIVIAPGTALTSGRPRGRAWLLLDAAVIAATLLAVWRYFAIHEELLSGLYFFGPGDVAYAALGVAAVLVLTKRSFGWPLCLAGLVALAYALFGEALPGILRHAGYSAEQTMRVVWYSFDGVFGRPVAVVTSVILVFVVFGAVLEGVGAGAVLLKLALRATGRLRGGPAHAAVVASGLFGTMSGSVTANVVGTGVFTIPMIKERGFKPRFAGGIEAAASSGGQFMPPVMGAVAFIMADVTGIPYLTICAAALLPACLYYASLFCAVSVEAAKRDVRPLPRAELPAIGRQDWWLTSAFAVPLAIIVAVLVAGRSAAAAGFYALLAALALGTLCNAELRARPQRLLAVFAKAGEACAVVLLAVASIGILIGVMNMTGLGLRFAALIQTLAGDSLALSLVLMMLGSLVLGMGMPTVPAYLVIVLVMGPAIERLGVPTLLAHLFVLYFGVLSAITPPVAIGAMVAAPIAGAGPMATATTAVRLAVIGFVIPFVLVAEPSLALVYGIAPLALLWVLARLALAIWLLTTAFAGYAGAGLTTPARLARGIAAAALLLPGLPIQLVGALAGTAVLAGERWLSPRKQQAEGG